MNIAPSDLADEYLPYREFQEQLDDAFGKDDPDKSIPWPNKPVPVWARGFRPTMIADLGCATGRFTSAVLARLGSWGCLENLDTLILVESELGFDSSDKSAEKKMLDRLRRALSNCGRREVEIRLVNASATVQVAAITGPEIMVGDDRLRECDLIIASHVTYYFGSDGLDLVSALGNSLKERGLAWVVIRKRNCPLYRARERVLSALHGDGPELGYAEDVGASLRLFDDLDLVATGDCEYLLPQAPLAECMRLANLLMWRTSPDPLRSSKKFDAAANVCRSGEAVFSERHFLLERKSTNGSTLLLG